MAKPGGDPSSGISLGDALILPKRHPACRRREAQPGSCTERENLSLRCQGRRPSGAHRKDQSTEAEHRGGAARSRDEGSVMELDRRGCVVQPRPRANRRREEPADKAKPFDIPKREVWEAFKRVKANPGAAVVRELLPSAGAAGRYSEGRRWHAPVGHPDGRRSHRSGGRPSVPGAVSGSGVPYRVLRLQARPSGARCRTPSSSALLALRLGARHRRQRLLRQYRLGAVAQGGPSSYELRVGAALRRALAEGAGADGGRQRRAAHSGNAAGWGHQPAPCKPVSALCVRRVDVAKLSAHSVREVRGRCHLSLQERRRGAGIMERVAGSLCGLQAGAASREDEDRLLQGCEPPWRLSEPVVRLSRVYIPGEESAGKGRRAFACFLPAAGPKALTSISRTVRRWALHHRSDKSLQDLAEMYNPCIRGWITYYSHFYKTQLRPTLKRIDLYVIRWARRKFKRLRRKTKGARDWFDRLRRVNPTLFAHWQLCHGNGRTSGAV